MSSGQRFSRAYHHTSLGGGGGGGVGPSSVGVSSAAGLTVPGGGGGSSYRSGSPIRSSLLSSSKPGLGGSSEFHHTSVGSHHRLGAATDSVTSGLLNKGPSSLSSSYLNGGSSHHLGHHSKVSSSLLNSGDISAALTYSGGSAAAAARQSRHRSMGAETASSLRGASPPAGHGSIIRNRSISPLRTSRLAVVPGAPSSVILPPHSSSAFNPEIVIGPRPTSSASVLNRLTSGTGGGDLFGSDSKEDEVFNAIRNRILQRSAVDRIASAANLPVSIVSDTFRTSSAGGVASAIPTSTFISELKTSLNESSAGGTATTLPGYVSSIVKPPPEINYSALLANSSAAAAAHEAEEIKNQIRAVKRSIGTETSTEIVRNRQRTEMEGVPRSHIHHHQTPHRKRHDSEESLDCCGHHHQRRTTSSGVHCHHNRPLVRSNSYDNLKENGKSPGEAPTTGPSGSGGSKRLRARHQTLAYGVSAQDLVAVGKLNPESWSTEDFQAAVAGVPLLPIGTATAATGPQDDFRQRSRNLRGFNSDMSVVTNVVDSSAAAAAAAAATANIQGGQGQSGVPPGGGPGGPQVAQGHHPHHPGGHAGPPSQPQHPSNIAAVHNHHAAKMMHPHEVENTCGNDVTLANVTLNRCYEKAEEFFRNHSWLEPYKSSWKFKCFSRPCHAALNLILFVLSQSPWKVRRVQFLQFSYLSSRKKYMWPLFDS